MLVRVLKSFLSVYHWIVSPWFGNRCRFVPSCSEYAQQALDKHGVGRGLYFTMRRLMRCHPWGGSGFDPVPGCGQCETEQKSTEAH